LSWVQLGWDIYICGLVMMMTLIFGSKPDPIKGTEYEFYKKTVRMLNETMGLCLR